MKLSNTPHLTVATITHPGMTGKNNEDRFLVKSYWTEVGQPVPVLLAVLCDGIGGHRAGEVAAETAVSVIGEVIGASDGTNPMQAIQEAIHTASRKIYDLAQSDPERQGMGATCVCILVVGSRLYAATVGDSRLYCMNKGRIQQVSTDHTWIQEAIERGVLTPDQAHNHPNAHVIRRYLGSVLPPDVDFRLKISGSETDAQASANQGFLLEPGDRLLLCSDGLTDLVEAPEILAVFEKQNLDSAAQTLVNLANERGGFDNITLVCVGVPEKQSGRFAAIKWRPWAFGCLALLAAAVVVAALVLGFLWLRRGGLVKTTPTATSLPANMSLLTPLATQQPGGEATLAPIFVNPSATNPAIFLVGPTITAWPTNTSLPTWTSAPLATPTP
jgi:PPM family protein phosphatase